ncbi:MAG: class I SAM-dependent methyltransferase [Sulfolobales archaeon]
MIQDRILRKLGITPVTPESFKILVSSLKVIQQYNETGDLESLVDWNSPVLPHLKRLDPDEIRYIELELMKPQISIWECQRLVQKVIPQAERKKFAAYYTVEHGVHFMSHIAHEYLENTRKNRVVLADPFLGSGVTLTVAIERIGAERLESVWGIEPLPLPALVAYASLLSATGGRRELVKVVVGDAFKVVPFSFSKLAAKSSLPKADIVLTNPPFTRWKHLDKEDRYILLETVIKLGYGEYISRREQGLHVLSMFLVDYVLNENGLVASVLPASTFYTIYGRGYKEFLKKKYDVLAVFENAFGPSFSEDSGFKEVILIAVKKPSKERQTVFAELGDNAEMYAKCLLSKCELDQESNMFNININEIPRFLNINWLALFGRSELRDFVVEVFKQGLKKGTLGYWSSILRRDSIVRGIEMYGPEFFFIPNKEWRVVREDNALVEVENIKSRTRLEIGREYLVKTLRKPSLYSYTIEAKVNTYMLSIPPTEASELPSGLRRYIEWGARSGTAKPAINAYGKYWYSHVYKQIATKKPFGKVFIPDKVDLMFKHRGVFANYSREKTAASKNFYIVRNEDETATKILIAWFNSTIFISILMLLGRRISETWTRLLENDYLELPVINVKTIDEDVSCELMRVVNEILDKTLPSFWNQLGEKYRYGLDLAIAEALRIENSEIKIKKLYQILLNTIQPRLNS